MMSPPARDEFRIGWICALPIEVAAAKEMLDVNFGILEEQDTADTNSYTLGQIGKHYVVIAGLGGQYGTTSATAVAINMMRTFSQSLRIGLMVGIGAGIPSPILDIRLGDVVVSYPEGTCGGVLQYDMGKLVKDGKFQRTGSLNSVPRSLLTAVTNMRAAALTDDPIYPEYIEKAMQRNTRTRRSFGRPDESTDRLFRVEHEHPTAAGTCKDCPKEWETPRDEREETDPQIHYGIIASGNVVMKHGATRERFRRETGALCFEMEAAGLMMDFPCIVVRGICDYADSHKNDEWQGYAALAAATYVKELLSYVPTGQVSQERLTIEICQVLIHPDVEEISSEMKEVKKGMDRALHQREDHHRENMERATIKEQEECHQVFKTSTYEQYKNINPVRGEGTCQWILENPQYKRWCESSHNDLLWVSADPGCGKSVLAKSLVDGDLKPPTSVSVCYFFFKDNGDQNNLANALCAVLHQLFGMQQDLLRHGLVEWKINGKKIQQEVEGLWRIFDASISDPAFCNTVCIFDALDECNPSDQARLIRKLANFYTKSHSQTKRSWLKFLVTSRPYSEIRDGFRPATQPFPQIHIRGEEENDKIHEEINMVVKMRVEELSQSERLTPETQQRLEQKLLQMEHRTYLWLDLAMEDIRTMFRHSLQPAEEMIQLIPASVTAAYEKILNRVPSDKKSDVRMILQLIVGARRPLKIEELAIALGIAMSFGSQSAARVSLDPEGLAEKIRQLCGLFVFIGRLDQVFLIHQTAREFLIYDTALNDGQKWSTDTMSSSHYQYTEDLSLRKIPRGDRKWYQTTRAEADLLILKVCLAYLSADEFDNGKFVIGRHSDTGRIFLNRDNLRYKNYLQYPFLNYSTSHWELHAMACYAAMPADFLKSVFTDVAIAPLLRDFWFLRLAENENEHEDVVKLMLDNGADVNAKDGSGDTPLKLAYWNNRKEVIKLLLNHGAEADAEMQQDLLEWAILEEDGATVKLIAQMGVDLDAKNKYGQLPLWLALNNGKESMVKLLVEIGADFTIEDKHGGTLLRQTVMMEKEATTRLLVERGANINAKNRYGETILVQAIEKKKEAMVKLLIEIGADINIEDDAGNLSLWRAIETENEAIVKLLVVAGANINAKDKYDSTVLSQAIGDEKEAMVKLLLEMGADVNMEDDCVYDLLWLAIRRENEAIVKLLAESGIDINAKDKFGQTVLLRAVGGEKEAMIKLLIEMGADVNLESSYNRTPLQQAISTENKEIVKLLVEMGADVNAKGTNNQTALFQAIERGEEAIVKLLIEMGADVNIKDDYGHTPLWQAIKGENEVIVRLLVEMGTEVNAKDASNQTVLFDATGWKKEAMVKLLIKMGADINAKDNYNRTPLWQAIDEGSEAMLKLLIEMGADINAMDNYGCTPLWQAIDEGDEAIVRLLIENGADINAKDIHDRTPLWQAIDEGNEAIVRLLIEMGADVNPKNRYGFQLLRWTKDKDNEAMVKLLVEMGAVAAEDTKSNPT
ncbi:ankyrin repeat-containing [Trichoderma arundinaceum]|uniref:Ankyrin repeat-containing n=1 Tax=Trichoderma arundinaceum TaxID=490622 RepID=A0A395NDY0_TRIAR|nr:ankyrin repeat-containing [Trichoderma arundinaceum]